MTADPGTPWEWAVEWESSPGKVKRAENLQVSAAASVACRIRVRYGMRKVVTFARRRNDGDEWEPMTWDELILGLDGRRQVKLYGLPGYLEPDRTLR